MAGVVLLAMLWPAAQAQVFWSVSDESGRQNWLLGTLHSEDARLLEWRRPLVEALQAGDRIALELVPTVDALARLREAMSAGETALADCLEPALHRRVVERLTGSYGLSSDEAEQLAPWAAAMILSTEPPHTGLYMDRMLANRARGAGLEVVGLETVQEQIDFLAGLHTEQQVALIRRAIDDAGQGEAAFESLVAAYLEGDLERLKRLTEQQMTGLDAATLDYFEQQGLAERNRRMLERATPWLAEGGLIMAVGALHLQGNDGLVAQLRARGWRVEGIY